MGKSAPRAPDPRETAAASTGTNVGTAVANAFMGNVNQVTPDGSVSYDQTDTFSWKDPYTGQTYEIPRFTATQTLSPEQQAIKEQGDAASLNLATLGSNLSGQLGGHLTDNFTIGNEDVEKRLFDLGSSRLDPQFAKQEEALRTRLLNSGIREGSAAWNSEMERHQQGRNDAYNSLLLSGRGQAVQEQLTEDNQRINQISALLSGGQVSQPQFVGTSMPSIPTTDVGGLINQNYQNQLGAWQSKQSGLGGLIGGIGSAAGNLLAAPSSSVFGSMIGLSDDDAKKDAKKIGKAKGLDLYEFRYKDEPGSSPKHVGLMASDVEKKKPAAVKRGKDGLRRVDYGKALGLMGA